MSRACKKRKKSTCISKSNLSAHVAKNDSCSLKDEIVNHLLLLKESKGLVIGFKAVMRGIKQNSLVVVLFISRRAIPAMYHAFSVACKDREILFLQLQDIDSILLNYSIPFSAVYGIKSNILLLEPKLADLSGRINRKLSSLKKSPGQSELKNSERECGNLSQNSEDDNFLQENLSSNIQNILHSKHSATKSKGGSAESFLSLEPENEQFPDYSLCI